MNEIKFPRITGMAMDVGTRFDGLWEAWVTTTEGSLGRFLINRELLVKFMRDACGMLQTINETLPTRITGDHCRTPGCEGKAGHSGRCSIPAIEVPSKNYVQFSTFYQCKECGKVTYPDTVHAPLHATGCIILLEESVSKDKHEKTKAGVTRSKKLRLSLVPGALLRFVASRFEYGISKGHEEGNWKLGAGDESSRAAALDHLYHHLLAYNDSGGADQLAAIACNAAMLCYYEEAKPFEPQLKHPVYVNVMGEPVDKSVAYGVTGGVPGLED